MLAISLPSRAADSKHICLTHGVKNLFLCTYNITTRPVANSSWPLWAPPYAFVIGTIALVPSTTCSASSIRCMPIST